MFFPAMGSKRSKTKHSPRLRANIIEEIIDAISSVLEEEMLCRVVTSTFSLINQHTDLLLISDHQRGNFYCINSRQ